MVRTLFEAVAVVFTDKHEEKYFSTDTKGPFFVFRAEGFLYIEDKSTNELDVLNEREIRGVMCKGARTATLDEFADNKILISDISR